MISKITKIYKISEMIRRLQVWGLDTFEKVIAELENVLLSMEKSYVLGFFKVDVHYDDFGQPWVDYMVDYINMHDYSDRLLLPFPYLRYVRVY